MRIFLITILASYRAIKHKLKMFMAHNWQLLPFLRPRVRIEKKWLGSIYGGFYVHPTILKPQDLVVSIGIGKDISFDLALINKYNLRVYAFDPTPKSLEWLKSQSLPSTFQYADYGLDATVNGEVTFYLPKDERAVSASTKMSDVMNEAQAIKVQMRTFDNIILNLPSKHIAILKMDIEGSEYEVLETLFKDPEVQIDQILVEFHDRMFKDIDPHLSKKSAAFLAQKGYVPFGCSVSSEEISFIHVSLIKE
jgi:FkbM family methyltransferase